jgi:hypothetical protein
MKPIISKNLTPPSLRGKGGFKASLRFGERFGEGLIYTLKTFKTSSKALAIINHGYTNKVHLRGLRKNTCFQPTKVGFACVVSDF